MKILSHLALPLGMICVLYFVFPNRPKIYIFFSQIFFLLNSFLLHMYSSERKTGVTFVEGLLMLRSNEAFWLGRTNRMLDISS